MSLSGSLFALFLIAAAGSDLARYRIPNAIVLALLAQFLVMALIHWGAVDWTSHLAAGVLCFIVTALLYARGMMGAGDAKLLAVLGLWAGLMPMLNLLFWMSVAGLGLVTILVTVRRAVLLSPAKAAGWLPERLPRVLRNKEGVPYGVAIATGALAASASFPPWLWGL